MKNKHLVLLFCLMIVFILSFSVVSAANVTKTHTKDMKVAKQSNNPIKKIATIKSDVSNKKAKDNKQKTAANNENMTIAKKNIIMNTKENGQLLKNTSFYGYNTYSYINVKPVSKTVYGRTANLEAKLVGYKSYDGGYVDFYVDDHYVGYKNAKSKVQLKHTFSDYGTHEYSVYYYDDYGDLTYNYATIKVKPLYTMNIAASSSIKAGKKASFSFKVLNKTSKVKNGYIKVYLNSKNIATRNMRTGTAKITYKMPNKAGTYKITAKYMKGSKVLKKATKKIKVKSSVTNKKSLLSKTVTFNSNYPYYKNTMIGSGDCLQSFIEYQDGQYDKGAYVSLFYHGTNGDSMIPYTYRLTKATFYHKNYYTGKVITDTVNPGCYYVTDKYTLVKSKLKSNYEPYKVQVYYRKMTNAEKNFLKKYA